MKVGDLLTISKEEYRWFLIVGEDDNKHFLLTCVDPVTIGGKPTFPILKRTINRARMKRRA